MAQPLKIPDALKTHLRLQSCFYQLLPGLLFVAAIFSYAIVLRLEDRISINEDAYILFSYARNLAETGVISYHAGGPPSEGATDFLYMVVLGALYRLGMPLGLGAMVTSCAGAAVTFAAVHAILKADVESYTTAQKLLFSLLLAVLLISATYLTAAVTGFSVFFFTASIGLMILAFVGAHSKLFYVAALATCLIRPDGFFVAGPLTLFMLYEQRNRKNNLAFFLIFLVIPGASYFVWRALYFGEWLPLPYYVKTQYEKDILGVFFGESLANSFWSLYTTRLILLSLPILLMSFPDFRQFMRRNAALIAAICVGFLFDGTFVQDQNVGYRFQAPLALLALVIVLRAPAAPGLRLLLMALAAVTAALPGYAAFAGTTGEARDDNIGRLADELRTLPRGTMLVSEAGRLPFRSGWIAIDSWGLNTPLLARRLIQPEDVKRYAPDLIVVWAHDDIRAIHAASFEPATLRTWDNHIHNVLLGAKGSYELYFVPRLKLGGTSDRGNTAHIVFMVKESSPFASALRDLIIRYDGVDFDALLQRLKISPG